MLAVIMLVSIAPLALAGEITYAGDSPIYSIDIWGIDYPPVAGEKAGDHRSVSIADDAHFSTASLVWINKDDNFTMDDDDVFVAGVNYQFGGLLYADPGYEFDMDWTMSLNFGDIEYDSLMTLVMPDHTQFRMWTAPVKAVEQNEELITSVSLSGIEFPPYVGESVEDYMTTPTVPAGAQYAVTAVYWYDDTHGVYLDDNAVFGSEAYYSIGFELKSFSGYRFGDSVSLSLNGGAITYDTAETGADPYNTTIFNVWTVPNKAEDPYVEPKPTPVSVLSVVNVPLNDVTAGNKPSDFDEPEIETYYGELDEVSWYNDTKESWVDNDEEFKSGFSYSMCMRIIAGPGNAFTDDIDITINGSADNVNWGATLVEPNEITLWTISVECPVDPDLTPIKSVDIAGVTMYPQDGAKAGDYLDITVSDEHVSIADKYWFCDNTSQAMEDDDKFVSGKDYSFCVELAADEGYYFPSDIAVSMNGDPDLIEFINFGTISYIGVWKLPVMCGEDNFIHITEVNLTDMTLNGPAGEDPFNYTDVTLPDDLHASIESVVWYNETTGKYVDKGELFELGNDYCLRIRLNPDEGYIFARNVKITINGSDNIVDYEYTTVYNGTLEIWTKAVPCYDATAYTLIESISMTDVDTTPVAGETPETHINYTLPADAHYTVAEVFWFNYDANEQLELTDVFEAGVRYQIVFRIVPDEGYRFAPYAVITINGGKVDGESGVREDGTYAMAGSLCEEAKVPGSDILIGDVNRDGKVNTADAVQVLKYAAGMISFDDDQLIAANTNRDDKVNTADAVLILKYAAGMITEF